MWIIYSLLTAISLATCDALTKRALRSRDEFYIAWARLAFALPILIPILFFVEIPRLDSTFWYATLTALPLEIIAFILYIKALKISPLSLTMPFLALTPLFLIVTSRIIVGESISVQGGIGIVLMAIGSYTLNLHRIKDTYLAPVRAIYQEKGSVLIIIVAFIYSITASLGKVAIEHSSPLFFGSFYFIIVTIIFTPIALSKNQGKLPLSKKDMLPLASIGFTFALMIMFHMTAMDISNVAYMISIKRTSLLFSVLYGYLLFRETYIAEKSIGATIMFAGFVVIVFST